MKKNKNQQQAIVASAEVLHQKMMDALTAANNAAVKKREGRQ